MYGSGAVRPIERCTGERADKDDRSESDMLALLRQVRQPLWIMLDDYPRDYSPELDACMDMLLDMGPAQVSWWVSSRRQPAWKLPRLLLQGHLLELEAEALAFTAEELEQLLNVHRLALSPETFQQLHRVMEGWPAGVCLMLLHADEQALRERLVAGTPLLRDYVQREVMAGLSDEVRRAMLALARMPRFSAELCDHVLDGVGREILDILKTLQLFIRQIDNCGEWFRLWKPLALMLQRSAETAAPTQAHLRACQWFASRGEMREAVEHALWAGQPEVAANYLQRYGQEQLLIGDNVSRFLKWRSELPQDLFASTTRLIVLQGWALIISARLDEVDDCLAELAKFFPSLMRAGKLNCWPSGRPCGGFWPVCAVSPRHARTACRRSRCCLIMPGRNACSVIRCLRSRRWPKVSLSLLNNTTAKV